LPTVYAEDQFSDDSCLYQHANPPYHKARSVRDNKFSETVWTAESPDVNPTEHLWDKLERRLPSRPQPLTSLTALATALQEEWAAILAETFIHLIKASPAEFELS
jgi:hypothetical protein